MRVVFFALNEASEYSGGRYHSWLMAEALTQAGNSICYVTNNLPVFYNDFSSFPAHQDVKIYLSKNFKSNLPEGHWDVVVLVPDLYSGLDFYLKVQLFAITHRSKLVLMNFETPDWFNLLSPIQRDPSLWKNWMRSSKDASLILSSSAEGNKFAKRFYNPCSKQTLFDYCYPSINSIVADSVVKVKKEKRIILITRFSDEHKGGASVIDLFCEAMRGYTLVPLVGSGEISSALMDKFRKKAGECGVKIEVKYKLTDREKFQEIKRSSLMISPSFFEGFGLPPVEAQYCNVPCIVFDLPVLKEVSGDGLIYVECGNWAQFRSKIKDVLKSRNKYKHLRGNIAEVAGFEDYVKRINRIMKRLMQHYQPCESRFKRFLKLVILYIEIYAYLPYRFYQLLAKVGKNLVRIILQRLLPDETFQRIRTSLRKN